MENVKDLLEGKGTRHNAEEMPMVNLSVKWGIEPIARLGVMLQGNQSVLLAGIFLCNSFHGKEKWHR